MADGARIVSNYALRESSIPFKMKELRERSVERRLWGERKEQLQLSFSSNLPAFAGPPPQDKLWLGYTSTHPPSSLLIPFTLLPIRQPSKTNNLLHIFFLLPLWPPKKNTCSMATTKQKAKAGSYCNLSQLIICDVPPCVIPWIMQNTRQIRPSSDSSSSSSASRSQNTCVLLRMQVHTSGGGTDRVCMQHASIISSDHPSSKGGYAIDSSDDDR